MDEICLNLIMGVELTIMDEEWIDGTMRATQCITDHDWGMVYICIPPIKMIILGMVHGIGLTTLIQIGELLNKLANAKVIKSIFICYL